MRKVFAFFYIIVLVSFFTSILLNAAVGVWLLIIGLAITMAIYSKIYKHSKEGIGKAAFSFNRRINFSEKMMNKELKKRD
ncbi:hypothetical protein HZI73_26400 (plasmid) [Vallitalea pronyensis]|uniref:Uncharacterized protein n=1 Tax=Vallitalea pronyensis TaxID=1348613 RepID=A0A8J8SJX7_9FIRM|nr:hypothetical protein [Vallitalea pronyensis]QUI25947.1 hypothetical protein HZI73_26400 [Vallitalea pronyensis]